MFSANSIKKRYFRVQLEKDGKELILDLKPPSMRIMRQLTDAYKKGTKEDVTAVDDIIEAVQAILNKNKTGYKVGRDWVEEMSIDQIRNILQAYIAWTNDTRETKN